MTDSPIESPQMVGQLVGTYSGHDREIDDRCSMEKVANWILLLYDTLLSSRIALETDGDDEIQWNINRPVRYEK